MKGKRLAIITTHPIQYNAPWFRLLSERGSVAVKVFYTWSQIEKEEKFDPGFGKNVAWDIPLLEGYDYEFVKNISKNPGSKTYKGIDNPELMNVVNQWKPDAVLVFGWKFRSHLKAIKHFKRKIPVLFRGDSHTVGRETGLKPMLRKWALKRVFRHIDYALYVGKANKQYFKHAGLKTKQLIRVPHAVDNDRFRRTDANVLAGKNYRQQMNISHNSLVFLFAGKFETVKNPMLLLNVAQTIQEEEVHFVFTGNGPLENKMKSLQRKNIHFMDFQNQQSMPALYQMSDVYILSSNSETWGLAVNEAMAAGKPVLVSDRCGCAVDLIKERETGLVFRSDDPDDLKNKLQWMITNKHKLNEMGEKARSYIQDWSFEHIVTSVEDFMKKI